MNITSIFGKGLWLVALILLLTVMPMYVFATGGGQSPTEAVPLGETGASGQQSSFEADWFTLTTVEGDEVSLVLTVTPEDIGVVQFVQLRVFTEDELVNYQPGDVSNMTSISPSQLFVDSADGVVKIRWSDPTVTGETYYVQVQNESDFDIRYQLTVIDAAPVTVNVESETPVATEEPTLTPTAAAIEATPSPTLPPDVTPTATPVTVASTGNNPDTAPYLLPGRTTGKLAPGGRYWYRFAHNDFQEDTYRTFDFTMFFTPDDGNRRHNVNYRIFRFDAPDEHFGAGRLVSRDGDFNTGERIWRGAIPYGEYLIAVENDSEVEIDYWIYDADIYNPILGEPIEPDPPLVFAQGAAPQTSTRLESLNRENLAPGEERWYSFIVPNFSGTPGQSPKALTMIVTPDDGNRIRDVIFEVYTARGAQLWSPRDYTRINNVGVGSVVYRDDNPETGERFWQGWVIDNNLYYVVVRNSSRINIDYRLYDGDVYSPELD